MSTQKAFLLGAIVIVLAMVSIANAIESFPEPNSYPDFNSDKIVNLVDFAVFAGNWRKSGSGLKGDFDKSGTVDTNDLATFAYFWLNGLTR